MPPEFFNWIKKFIQNIWKSQFPMHNMKQNLYRSHTHKTCYYNKAKCLDWNKNVFQWKTTCENITTSTSRSSSRIKVLVSLFSFPLYFFILLIYARIIQHLLLMFSPAEEGTLYSKSIFQMPTNLAIFTYSSHFIIRIVSLFPMAKQKQPPRGVFKKRCSENMQQIYRRTPMRKRDFNKAALKLYWNLPSAWVFSCKIAAYFQNTFSQRSTLRWLLLAKLTFWSKLVGQKSSAEKISEKWIRGSNIVLSTLFLTVFVFKPIVTFNFPNV